MKIEKEVRNKKRAKAVISEGNKENEQAAQERSRKQKEANREQMEGAEHGYRIG